MHGLRTLEKMNGETAREYGARMDARLAKLNAETDAKFMLRVKLGLTAFGLIGLFIFAVTMV